MPTCTTGDVELTEVLWGALFGATYPSSGAPRAEPTVFTFTTRGGSIPCRTTNSDETLEIRDATNRTVYRVERLDPTSVITTPGRWLDFMVGVLWDPTCQADAQGGWNVTTCVPVAAGDYRVTLTTHGMSSLLPIATIGSGP